MLFLGHEKADPASETGPSAIFKFNAVVTYLFRALSAVQVSPVPAFDVSVLVLDIFNAVHHALPLALFVSI